MAGNQSAELLTAARAALNGTFALPPASATRAAALLTRTALEHLVDDYLTSRGNDIRTAGMRVRLICLRTLVGEALGGEAVWAWGALSGACHRHAYELAPTISEVSHLLAAVTELSDRLDVTPPTCTALQRGE